MVGWPPMLGRTWYHKNCKVVLFLWAKPKQAGRMRREINAYPTWSTYIKRNWIWFEWHALVRKSEHSLKKISSSLMFLTTPKLRVAAHRWFCCMSSTGWSCQTTNQATKQTKKGIFNIFLMRIVQQHNIWAHLFSSLRCRTKTLH